LKSWAISLSELMAGICNDIPIAKVDEILAADAQSSTSLVDSSTERAFQSPELRRYLVALAKGVQRAANSSCLPEAELRPVVLLPHACFSKESPQIDIILYFLCRKQCLNAPTRARLGHPVQNRRPLIAPVHYRWELCAAIAPGRSR
jgi:hypothetical protein